MSLAVWLRHHSQACEASLHRYYGADLGDWYRGRVSARWLWARLFNLPIDSPLGLSTAGEFDEIVEQHQTEPLPWPPRTLYSIPVAKSFAEVGQMLSGADLN